MQEHGWVAQQWRWWDWLLGSIRQRREETKSIAIYYNTVQHSFDQLSKITHSERSALAVVIRCCVIMASTGRKYSDNKVDTFYVVLLRMFSKTKNDLSEKMVKKNCFSKGCCKKSIWNWHRCDEFGMKCLKMLWGHFELSMITRCLTLWDVDNRRDPRR